MSNTVVGLFKTPTEAQSVKQRLVEEGYSSGSIRVLSNETDGFAEGAMAEARPSTAGETGIMGSIKNFFHSFTDSGENEQEYYTRGLSAGGALLAVTVDDARAESVASLLERYGAEEVNEEGATGVKEPTRAATGNASATASTAAQGQAIPIVEEELQIGKRQVQRGGVRVYSHVVETPVEENVQLREERVHVQRNAVNRPASEADFNAFKEGTIELTETAEEVVVGKQARVVEEITVGKDVTERTQTVKDTLRHTEVDVEEIPGEVSQKSASAGKL